MKIYTDGSFDKKRSMSSTAYAAVIVLEETSDEYIVDIIYGVNTDPQYTAMWNVGGEIWAVLVGIDYIIEKYNPNDIALYYDYIGIGRWANESWKANNPITTSYTSYMKNLMKDRSVTYNHIPGHSNIVLNELADEYAKYGTAKYLKTGEVSTLIKNLRVSKK